MKRREHLLALVVVALSAGAARPSDKVEYNRDIRPILAENCFACHGPDSASRKAGLRLDRRDDAVSAEAFVPGDAQKSELLRRIALDKGRKQMPPASTHKKLTVEQKELLRRWI